MNNKPSRPSSTPKKKSRRMRRKRNMQKDMTSAKPRTLDDIMKTLSYGMTTMAIGNKNHYMACRLSAMAPQNPPEIPDGMGGKRILTCLYKQDVLSINGASGATISIQLLPWLPAPLAIQTTTGTPLMNGTNLSIYGSRPGGAAISLMGTTGAWVTAPGFPTVSPYGASAVRFVSIGMRIRYTGQASTCAGLLQCYRQTTTLGNPVTVTTSSSTNTAPTTGVFMDLTNINGTVLNYVEVGTTVMQVEGLTGPNSTPSCGVTTFRPEQGIVVRLNHKGAFHEVPWLQNYAGVAQALTNNYATGDLNNMFVTFSNDGSTTQSGLCAWDNDWDSSVVRIVSPNSDASYLIETCVCLEVYPTATSQFFPLARDAGPKNPAMIATTEKIIESAQAIPAVDPK